MTRVEDPVSLLCSNMVVVPRVAVSLLCSNIVVVTRVADPVVVI